MKNACIVPLKTIVLRLKSIQMFENSLSTSRNEFTSEEMTNANVPRDKDTETYSIKANMIFDNRKDEYIVRLKNLSQRYEAEISDVYKQVQLYVS